MTVPLAADLTLRSPISADIQEVAELVRACELTDTGSSDVDTEVIQDTWQGMDLTTNAFVLVNAESLFKWRHFEAEMIVLCVRWYLRYALSYRDLEEIMLERGLRVDHSTIFRWVQRYAPDLEKRCRPYLAATNESWRVDEMYVKVKGVWMYLYRAVDSQGNTLEFHFSITRDAQAAKRFFAKALGASHTVRPRVITVDKNAAYPKAFKELQTTGVLPANCELRQSKYLNNLVEQDHRAHQTLGQTGIGVLFV